MVFECQHGGAECRGNAYESCVQVKSAAFSSVAKFKPQSRLQWQVPRRSRRVNSNSKLIEYVGNDFYLHHVHP